MDIKNLLKMGKFMDQQKFNLRHSAMYKRADYRLRKVMDAYPPFVMYYMAARDVLCVIEAYNMPPTFDMPVTITCVAEPLWNWDKHMESAMGERTFDCPLNDLMPFTHRILAQAETAKGMKKITRTLFEQAETVNFGN